MDNYNLKEVDIVLDDSSHAKFFDREKLIHEYEYDQAIGFIDGMIPETLIDDANKYLHNTITVFGTRGSGKTSFLLSLKRAYETNLKLKTLRIIDPTLIEEKGHVFLNVIAAIRDEVFEEIEIMAPDDSQRETKRKWRESMMKLAAGLPSIDGMNNNNDDRWQDPEYVLDNGLVSVSSALNLGDNFNDFLTTSLRILKKTSFLLIFDDIDVDATKGWAVLETIRKYFTTSKLLTVLSGDLKLYSLVVRQKKWSNFGAEILSYEGDKLGKLSYFNGMVTELEAQYLQKIMQPRYRIHLLSLQEKKQINRLPKIRIIKNEAEGNRKIEIQELYGIILACFGIHNVGQAEVFKTFILSQPFRTQIQFASIMSNYILEDKVAENSEKITDIFLADLLEQEVDVNLLNSTAKFRNSITLKLLLKRSQLKDLYQLQPSTTDNSLNACLISLNLLLSKSFLESNFFLSFDYMIKMGYIRNLTNTLVEAQPGYNQPSIADLCDKAGVFNDGVLRDTTGKINAYMTGVLRSRNGRNDPSPSNINLLGLNGPGRRQTEDRLDFVFPNNGSLRSILAYLPSYSAIYSFKNNSTVGYSIYMVIAAIGELVRVYESQAGDSDDQQIKERIKSALRELSQHRQYPVPDFKSGLNVATRNDDRDSIDEIGDFRDDHEILGHIIVYEETLLKDIIIWLKKVPKNVVAIHVLGKISTRFYSALQNIYSQRPVGMQLGELFHFQIIAFMNAILIEDIRENLIDSSHLNINNTNFSERGLINNLQKTVDLFKHKMNTSLLWYSQWMLSCPILRSYIKVQKEDLLNSLLNAYCGCKKTTMSYGLLNISKDLDRVTIENNIQRTGLTSTSIKRAQRFSDLALVGNELKLIDTLRKRHGDIVPLIQEDDLKIMRERNAVLKKVLPGLFSDNNQYSTKARNLRARLKELKLVN